MSACCESAFDDACEVDGRPCRVFGYFYDNGIACEYRGNDWSTEIVKLFSRDFVKPWYTLGAAINIQGSYTDQHALHLA